MLVDKRWYRSKTRKELEQEGIITYGSDNNWASNYNYNGINFLSIMANNKLVYCDMSKYELYNQMFEYKGYYWQEWMLVPLNSTLMETE